jgi:hypothetical protein
MPYVREKLMTNEDPTTVSRNPWFTTSSGLVDFVVFESRIKAIGQWKDYLTIAVSSMLLHEGAAYQKYIQEAPDGWKYEARISAEDEFDWIRQVVPLAAYGGLVAIAFGSLETLMGSLIAWQEEGKEVPFKTFSKGNRGLESQRLYLEQIAEWPIKWDENERESLETYRKLRNKAVHAMGVGPSESEAQQLPIRMERTEKSDTWSKDLVEAMLFSCGAFVTAVEEGYMSAIAD